ncbi:hypothetical protein MPSI1_003641 [Malassezia psittaci]|uniref:Maltose/galactoside acetyltransferase domain-containing protein n=1 Tax=Malassezia psittaci TaxID=1821823 RepID=A0AAF0FF93_9BASI|nr:hypothetical protein MPSI1_003641 [Malassezia psittaci]
MSTQSRYDEIDKQFAAQLPHMTERQKMLKGLPYNPLDRELVQQRIDVRKLTHAFNMSPPANFPGVADPPLDITGSDRRKLLAEIFKLKDGQEEKIDIEPPLWM